MTAWGIALGGGGAKGLAHIGALEVLADAGLEFDVIVGTSAGALVGAIFASNQLPGLIRDVRELRLVDIPRLLSPSWSLAGLFTGKNALHLLERHFSAPVIEDFPRKFGAVSCDLTGGKSILFSKGSASQAVRASIAIPGVFTPVCISGRVYVDGGVLEPLPVARGKELGAEKMIAIDLFADDPPIRKGTESQRSRAISYLQSLISKRTDTDAHGEATPLRSSIFDVLMDTLIVSQRHLTAEAFKTCTPEFVIRPKVGGVGILDFHRGDAVMEIGRTAAREELVKIKEAMRKG